MDYIFSHQVTEAPQASPVLTSNPSCSVGSISKCFLNPITSLHLCPSPCSESRCVSHLNHYNSSLVPSVPFTAPRVILFTSLLCLTLASGIRSLKIKYQILTPVFKASGDPANCPPSQTFLTSSLLTHEAPDTHVQLLNPPTFAASQCLAHRLVPVAM